MGTRTWGGENVLGANPGPEKSNKLTKQVIVIFVVWFVAMASLLGVHFILKRRSQADRKGSLKIQSTYVALSDEEKIRIKYFEAGIIRLANGDVRIVDGNARNNDQTLFSGNRLTWKKINFSILDPLLAEREANIHEAIKTLNNAEKRCYVDRHATIINKNGDYYLVIDSETYADYVRRYGTECSSCGKELRETINSKNGRNEK